MGGDLDKTCCLGEVERRVPDFGEKDGVYFGVELEVFEDLETLGLRGFAVDEGFLQLEGVGFKGVDVVREDDDLVTAFLVVVD